MWGQAMETIMAILGGFGGGGGARVGRGDQDRVAEGDTPEETVQGQTAPLVEKVSTQMPMVQKHPVRISGTGR